MGNTCGCSLLESLKWRYATKHFDANKKISAEKWEMLAEVLRLAPSSYGLQPWQFIVVNNPDLRKSLRAVSWNQPQIEECSHLVVISTLKKVTADYVQKFISKIAKVRGIPEEGLNDYRNMMLGDIVNGPRAEIAHAWTQRQAYIAMGFLLESAALLEIDACPMEGLSSPDYDKILGLAGSDYSTVAVVTLGYRAEDDSYQHLPKVRFDSSEILRYV